MKKLLNMFNGSNHHEERFIILQWGIKRSIIQNVTDLSKEKIIIDNQRLMNLDERGLIV